jgi:hypothetical protein
LQTSGLRGPLPRGAHGIDFHQAQARNAQCIVERLREDKKRIDKIRRQQELKAALDQQIEEKQIRKVREWEEDAVTVYGHTLAVGLDEPSRKRAFREHRAQLEETWKGQVAEAQTRKQKEDEYYARREENWITMDAQMQNLRDEVPAQQPWLKAWQEHKNAEASMRNRAEAHERKIEQETIASNIASYSDRILLAEKQRRDMQEAYRRQLDEQVRAKALNHQRGVHETILRDSQLSGSFFV